ncbi:MAG: EF-hand domain-containing protein [Deltaproteobacteria bacterium]|nr:EF-hand domain-containing protein [Deltaproteobacteria bacterium]
MEDKALQEEVKLAPAIEEVVAEKEEEPTKEKFVGGEVPAVAAAAPAVAATKTASQHAYDGDSNKTELATKLGALVDDKYSGDLRQAFAHYGDLHSHDPSLDTAELGEMLKDAGVGNSMNRGEWVTAVFDRFDTDKSGKINWRDFQKFVKPKKKSDVEAASVAPVAAPTTASAK